MFLAIVVVLTGFQGVDFVLPYLYLLASFSLPRPLSSCVLLKYFPVVAYLLLLLKKTLLPILLVLVVHPWVFLALLLPLTPHD